MPRIFDKPTEALLTRKKRAVADPDVAVRCAVPTIWAIVSEMWQESGAVPRFAVPCGSHLKTGAALLICLPLFSNVLRRLYRRRIHTQIPLS